MVFVNKARRLARMHLKGGFSCDESYLPGCCVCMGVYGCVWMCMGELCVYGCVWVSYVCMDVLSMYVCVVYVWLCSVVCCVNKSVFGCCVLCVVGLEYCVVL